MHSKGQCSADQYTAVVWIKCHITGCAKRCNNIIVKWYKGKHNILWHYVFTVINTVLAARMQVGQYSILCTMFWQQFKKEIKVKWKSWPHWDNSSLHFYTDTKDALPGALKSEKHVTNKYDILLKLHTAEFINLPTPFRICKMLIILHK